MKGQCDIYESQIRKAKETLVILEDRLQEVRLNLKSNPDHPAYTREMKKVMLDMTITLNEIEHSQAELDKCNRAIQEEQYND